MPETPRIHFDEELQSIKKELLRIASYVESIIPQVTEAFIVKDLETAQTIIDGDDPLDRDSVNLEERCCQALALQQPMAKDLRYIVSAMSINNDLERSGDLAVNVAKATHRLKDSSLTPELQEIIQKMSDQARILVGTAMAAYEEEDLAKSDELEEIDDLLDQLNYDCTAAALNAGQDGTIDLKTAIQIALIGRYYERIGDHAVNIGERIRYMITGVIEHL